MADIDWPEDWKEGDADPTGVKLFPYLGEHKKVMHHAAFLKFLVRLGVVITEVHSLWSFKQTPWMRPYVQDIANRRAVEKDDVKKECQKKSMNTLYGKSCQDQRGYRNVNPHFDQEEFERQVAKRNVTDWDVSAMPGRQPASQPASQASQAS